MAASLWVKLVLNTPSIHIIKEMQFKKKLLFISAWMYNKSVLKRGFCLKKSVVGGAKFLFMVYHFLREGFNHYRSNHVCLKFILLLKNTNKAHATKYFLKSIKSML